MKEILAACADSCRTSDAIHKASKQDPGIPELLAPVSFALLPCMLEGSNVALTPEHLSKV